MIYKGERVSFPTLHGKEKVVAPELLQSTGLELVHINTIDTDQLGTFTREIPRYGTQLEAARKKATLGMEISGLSLGLASEGAFSNDPFTGILPWNFEILIFIDTKRELEIIGQFGGPAQSASKSIKTWREVENFLIQAQFPSHHLVIRPDDENHPECQKGINDLNALKLAFHWAMENSTHGKVFLENDLRAHANPTRMGNILNAAKNLCLKLNSLCPECQSPGFHVSQLKKGLPCALCSLPTQQVQAEIWTCPKCKHETLKQLEYKNADPSRCSHCNP